MTGSFVKPSSEKSFITGVLQQLHHYALKAERAQILVFWKYRDF